MPYIGAYDQQRPFVPSGPSTIAATPAFNVSDARKKKQIAEALRAKVAGNYTQQDPLVRTEGVGAYPGQVDINYGAILANAAQPWMESRREEKALAAEDEAQTSQDLALQQLLGTSNNGSLSMENAVKLSELTGQDYTNLVSKPSSPTALIQQMGPNAPTALAAKVMAGQALTPDELAQVDKAKADWAASQQRNKVEAATAGRSVNTTNVDLRQGTEGFSDIAAKKMAEQVGKDNAAEFADATSRLDVLGQGDTNLDELDRWANTTNPDVFTVPQAIIREVDAAGVPVVGMWISDESKRANQAASMHIREALKDAGGNDSNTDLKFAARASAISALTQSQARAMVKFQRAASSVAQEALQMKREWLMNEGRLNPTAKRPNFYLNARKKYADQLESSMAEYEAAPKVKTEGMSNPLTQKESNSGMVGDGDI